MSGMTRSNVGQLYFDSDYYTSNGLTFSDGSLISLGSNNEYLSDFLLSLQLCGVNNQGMLSWATGGSDINRNGVKTDYIPFDQTAGINNYFPNTSTKTLKITGFSSDMTNTSFTIYGDPSFDDSDVPTGYGLYALVGAKWNWTTGGTNCTNTSGVGNTLPSPGYLRIEINPTLLGGTAQPLTNGSTITDSTAIWILSSYLTFDQGNPRYIQPCPGSTAPINPPNHGGISDNFYMARSNGLVNFSGSQNSSTGFTGATVSASSSLVTLLYTMTNSGPYFLPNAFPTNHLNDLVNTPVYLIGDNSVTNGYVLIGPSLPRTFPPTPPTPNGDTIPISTLTPSTDPPPPTPSPTWPKYLIYGAIGLIALILIIGLIWYLAKPKPSTSPTDTDIEHDEETGDVDVMHSTAEDL